jgi:hypothetical protein
MSRENSTNVGFKAAFKPAIAYIWKNNLKMKGYFWEEEFEI